MIISIPTNSGMVSFALNAALLKLLAVLSIVLVLIAGYSVVQLCTFVLSATPIQFLHIVIFVVFVAGILFVVRLGSKKAGTI